MELELGGEATSLFTPAGDFVVSKDVLAKLSPGKMAEIEMVLRLMLLNEAAPTPIATPKRFGDGDGEGDIAYLPALSVSAQTGEYARGEVLLRGSFMFRILRFVNWADLPATVKVYWGKTKAAGSKFVFVQWLSLVGGTDGAECDPAK